MRHGSPPPTVRLGKVFALPIPQSPILVPSMHRPWIGSNLFRGAGAAPCNRGAGGWGVMLVPVPGGICLGDEVVASEGRGRVWGRTEI